MKKISINKAVEPIYHRYEYPSNMGVGEFVDKRVMDEMVWPIGQSLLPPSDNTYFMFRQELVRKFW